MWAFLRRKRPQAQQSSDWAPSDQGKVDCPLSLQDLEEQLGEIHDLTIDDVALKFWLPEAAEQAIRKIASDYSTTMSRLIRNFLIVHCYGLYTFEYIRQQFGDPFQAYDTGARFSLRSDSPQKPVRIQTYWVPELGKNIKPMKVWIPLRLKGDLGKLAEHVGVPPSNYVREILIGRFLGHGMLPMRPEMLKPVPTQAAKDWEEGREVPWKEVTERESEQYGEVRIETKEG